MGSSPDEIARSARMNLQSSLRITHHLTLNSQSPGDYVIHRMNEMLASVVNTNFDSSSMSSVGRLYGAIGEVQPLMINMPSDISLINLSRTIAVVMEEAISIKSGRNATNNNPTSEWDVSDNAGFGQNGTEDRNSRGSSYGRPPQPFFGVVTTPAAAAAAARRQQFGGVGQPSKPANGFCISDAVRAYRAEREKRKDYSPEGIMGRIAVFKIPNTVTEMDVRAHFTQIGTVVELSYPTEKGKHKGIALLKFADNATADSACVKLNGVQLGGSPLSVQRATYWWRDFPLLSATNDAPAFGTGSKDVPVSGSGSGKAIDAQAAGSPTRLSSSSVSTIGTACSTYTVPRPNTSDEDEGEKEEKESVGSVGSVVDDDKYAGDQSSDDSDEVVAPEPHYYDGGPLTWSDDSDKEILAEKANDEE